MYIVYIYMHVLVDLHGMMEVRESLLDELRHCAEVLKPFLVAREEPHEDLAIQMLLELTSAEAACLAACSIFFDVLCFDTTYSRSWIMYLYIHCIYIYMHRVLYTQKEYR